LADAEDLGELSARIARALGAERGQDLREAALAAPPTLLVLDNLEQLVPAGALEVVARLLTPGSGLRLLVTSQHHLQHPAEILLELPPLGLPIGDAKGHVAASGSGRLFAQRAGNLGSLKSLSENAAGAVARICRRLEGLPLALELAASWTDVLSLDELDRQLADTLPDLGTLRADRPDRHRSVRAAVTWGLSRLPPHLQEAHARLSLLPASFNLAAARAVGGLDAGGLQELVLRSLVARERAEEGPPRFRLLEPVRRVAEERLSAESRAEALSRLAEHFAARAVAEFSHEKGGLEIDHAADLPNFELALDTLRAYGEAERAAEVTLALYLLWFRLGHPESGIARIQAVYEELPPEAALLKAATANTIGAIGYFVGDKALAEEWFGLRLKHLQEVGTPFQIAGAQTNVGIAHQMAGRYEEAAARFRDALTVVLDGGIPRQQAAVLINLGSVLFALGERTEGRAAYQKALAVAEEHCLGQLVGDCWQQMAEEAWLNGEYEVAEAWFVRAVEKLGESSDRLRHVESLASLSLCRIERGDLPGGRAALGEIFPLMGKISGAWTWRYVLEAAGAVAESSGDPATAAVLAGASERLSQGMMAPQPNLEIHFAARHAALERRMGSDAYRAAWTIGQTLSRKELRARLEAERPPSAP
ncbi:tetratricopeptide repeat protein, partial [bacterium]